MIKPAWKETIYPSPAVLQAAAKFLKDNSVFATPEQNADLDKMREQLRKRVMDRKPTAQDQNDALAAFGGKQLQ